MERGGAKINAMQKDKSMRSCWLADRIRVVLAFHTGLASAPHEESLRPR